MDTQTKHKLTSEMGNVITSALSSWIKSKSGDDAANAYTLAYLFADEAGIPMGLITDVDPRPIVD